MYHLIFAQLRERIVEGAYATGEAVPGELELGEQFKVSRITARRALDELAASGLVERRQGRGTFVSGNAAAPPVRTSLEDFLEYNRAITERTKATLLSLEYVDASANISKKLQSGDEQVLLHQLVRVGNEGPTMFVESYYRRRVAERFDARQVGTEPSITLLRKAGIRVADGEQILSAISADFEVAQILEVAPGSPLLLAERILNDTHGTPLEFIRMMIRPDRHQLTMEFSPKRAPTVRRTRRS